MDFIFVSMPYARFDSKWFANVPNVNLGIMKPYLAERKRSVKTFHLHMMFMSHLDAFDDGTVRSFIRLSHEFGVEYLSLDYVFATLLFQDTYLRSRDRFGHRLQGIGLSLDHFERFREVAKSFLDVVMSMLKPSLGGAKLLGFTCSHYQLSGSLLVSLEVKKRYPRLPIIVGGKDCAGPFAEELLSQVDYIDFVGVGECETTIDSLLKHIDDGNSPVYNVLYRGELDRVQASQTKESGALDDLPFPEYDLDELPIKTSEVILPLELGRGCPWGKCTFCPDQAYQIRCQSKTAARVKAEIEHYQESSADLRNFFILDSDALKAPDTIVELSHYLKGMGLSFHFAEFRAERMNRRLVEALLDFGNWVTPFQVGIETFSDKVLRLMNKGVSALKNVEVIKMVAEMGIPLQFNLFTCYPNMTTDDLIENLRVMDAITHLLVCENIQFFPGEFYLPKDCPIYVDIDDYRVEKNSQSLFSDMFDGFPMPSFSNYPYAYAFHNEEEQYRIATAIRDKAGDINQMNRQDNFMEYTVSDDVVRIVHAYVGNTKEHTLKGMESQIYLAAVNEHQDLGRVSDTLDIPASMVRMVLDDLEQRSLILYSEDREAFLSLAMRGED